MCLRQYAIIETDLDLFYLKYCLVGCVLSTLKSSDFVADHLRTSVHAVECTVVLMLNTVDDVREIHNYVQRK